MTIKVKSLFLHFSALGYVLGGHVMRLFHGHDEVVTIPGSDKSEEQQRYKKKKKRFITFGLM